MLFSLKARNTDKKYDLLFVNDEDNIIICDNKGNKIAQINIDTMMDNDKEFTEGYHLYFNTNEKYPIDKNIASIYPKE